MAMIDYGAIAWKDRKLISTDMFTDMEEMVGWSDKDSDKDIHKKLDGNWFAYIGDKDLVVCFYKQTMKIYKPGKEEHPEDTIFFGMEDFIGWTRWEHNFYLNKDYVQIKVYPVDGHEYYLCKMKYRGHKYKVAFGYGVDLGYYKKYHIIDYYGTPWFKARELYNDIVYKIRDWRR